MRSSTPEQLRRECRALVAASAAESDPRRKRELAARAFALAQEAERMERAGEGQRPAKGAPQTGG